MTRGTRVSPVRLLLAVVLLLASAACGIPTDDAPRPLAEATTTTEPTTAPPGGSDQVSVFLSQADRGGQLVRVERTIDGPPTPTVALELLFGSPLDEDTARGLTTSIPSGTSAVAVSVDDDLISIEMSEEWEQLGTGATAAYAQVVFTVTDLPGIEQVQFSLGGDPIDAPTVNEGTKPAVGRSDYASFAPEDG
ncbi:MAG: GerMN domain-containing protein [Acidimicrobiales bacterium]|nr:GerMN domain-containing protein [Acidimicrobiales bacterium]